MGAEKTRKSRRDPVVDSVAVAWWFETVRAALGKETAYGVEKVIEPTTFNTHPDDYWHNNKWSGYRSGRHMPRAGLIRKTEAICPGSSAALAHPAWQIARLKADETLGDCADLWLRQLNAWVRHLFFRTDPKTGGDRRRGVSNRVLRLLSHRTDLDSIAALSIVIREANESGNLKLAMKAGEALYFLLLNASGTSDERIRTVLPKVFTMLRERIFPFAHDKHYYYCFDELDFESLCRLFQDVLRERHEAVELSKQGLAESSIDSPFTVCMSERYGPIHFMPPKRPLSNVGNHASEELVYKHSLEKWRVAIQSMVKLKQDAT